MRRSGGGVLKFQRRAGQPVPQRLGGPAPTSRAIPGQPTGCVRLVNASTLAGHQCKVQANTQRARGALRFAFACTIEGNQALLVGAPRTVLAC